MTPRKDRPKPQDDVTRLTAALHEHEEALLAIPGVTGCGVGLATHGHGDRIVIQVFVPSQALIDLVQRKAIELLGAYPVEIVVMPIPDAG
jgi:hypothetical protein